MKPRATSCIVDGVTQTSTVEIKSTDFTVAQMEALESVLYGTGTTVDARLPAPGEVKTILAEAAN